jgi:N-acetylmuramoyl-L-alanine amidase
MLAKKSLRFAISAGHFKAAKGAGYHGVYEWDIAKIWQNTLGELLLHRGHTVFFVPHKDLKGKVAAINNSFGKFDLALEIHFNAGGNDSTSGAEVLHYPGGKVTNIKTAANISKAIATAMKIPDRGAKEGWYKMDRPNIVDYSGDVNGDESIDYFLRATNCPALIVEPEFIHHAVKWSTSTITDCCQAVIDALEFSL